MALNFDLMAASDTAATIEVVTKFDACIDMTISEYEEYIASGANPEKLKLKEGKMLEDCTIFVLKKNLDWSGHEALMQKQFKIDMVTKQPILNPAFVMTDIQQSLVEIKEPKNADFKFNFKGSGKRKIIEALHNGGILMDLFQARSSATGGAKTALIEKKK